MSPGSLTREQMEGMEPTSFDDPAMAILNRRKPKGGQFKKAEKARTTVDRENPELEEEIEADPATFMRKQLTAMLAKEVAINSKLYTIDPPPSKEISESTKRIVDLGNALKALPNQSAGQNLGAQLSTAEIIARALDEAEQEPEEALSLGNEMMERADAAFGLGDEEQPSA